MAQDNYFARKRKEREVANTRVQLTPGDPKLPHETRKAANEADASQFDPAKAAADARVAELTARIKTIEAANAGGLTQAELEKKGLEVEKLQAEIAKISKGKGSALDALQGQVDRVGELYRQSLKGGVPNGIASWAPDMLAPQQGQFDSAAQGLTNPFMAAFRVEGQGSQSDTELRQFLQANTPAQGDSDLVIEEKLGNIQRRIDAERGTLNQPVADPPAPPPADPLALAKDGARTQIDPALRALGARVGDMLAKGVPEGRINKFLKENGVDPASTNVGQAFQHRKKPEFRAWQRANPGKPYPIGPEFYTREVPMSATRQFINNSAQSIPGAFVASAGNALTGGRLDNMAASLGGDPEMVRTGMQLLRSERPLSTFAGDVAGQMAVEATVGRIPGARGLMATRWGRRGADAAYGAYSGSGEADSVEGGFTGALTNSVFGGLGRNAQRGLGGAFTGAKNANLDYLDRAGVPMTVGQIGRGTDSRLGNFVGGLEERALGLPGLDAIIGGARRQGDEGFNRAAFREMGGSGATGAAGVAEGQQLVRNAYGFLDGANIPIDAPFAGSQAGVRASLPGLPAFGDEIGKSLDTIDQASMGGSLSGRNWQSGLRATKANRASVRGQPFSDEAYNVLGDVENNLLDLAARQGPPGAAGDLASANRLNSRFQTIVDALDNGPAQRAGELFSASRLNDASRKNARNFGGKVGSIKGNRPFYDLTSAGMATMPNLTPDSGSIGRLMLIPAAGATIGGIGGALGGESPVQGGIDGGSDGLATGAGAVALLSALYSKPGQRGLQRAILGQRPHALDVLGQAMKRNPQFAGALAAALGRDFIQQPELP